MAPDRVRPLNDSSEQPTQVGRYGLAYELAAGGMATVYLARSEGAAGFEKVVALKRIHPHLAREQDFIEMFLDEARIASRINHPNVCSVFDFGEVEGTHYIAMEYVLGETLGRVLKKLSKDREELLRPRTLGYACKIIADACDGLHAAHELRGDGGKLLDVVHRDVSPQNLFVAYDGTVRVVDFGIARAAGRLHETRTGAVKGKLAYMAPEQSKKLPLDRRADVWALGAVLWEIVCGDRLFKRDNDVETIMAVVADEIPKPSSRRPDVPEELERIIMKALERDREKRYASARELGRDLHRFLGKLDEPVTTGDVADWMAELFPKEKQERLALVDNVRTGRATKVERISESLADEFSGSEVRAAASQTTPSKPSAKVTESEPPPEPTAGGLTMEISEDDIVAAGAMAGAMAEAGAAPGRISEAPPEVSGEKLITPATAAAGAGSGDELSETPVLGRSRSPLVYVGIAAVALLALVVTLVVASGGDDDADAGGDGAGDEIADTTATQPTEVAETGSIGSSETSGASAIGSPETGVRAEIDQAEIDQAELDTEADTEIETETGTAIDDTATETETETDTDTETATSGAGAESPSARATKSRRATRVRPTHTAAAPAGPGFVDIATPGGWADVYLRGRNLGRAPGRVTLPAGRQSLEVRPFGRANDARRVLVTVQAGASQRLVVNLR